MDLLVVGTRGMGWIRRFEGQFKFKFKVCKLGMGCWVAWTCWWWGRAAWATSKGENNVLNFICSLRNLFLSGRAAVMLFLLQAAPYCAAKLCAVFKVVKGYKPYTLTPPNPHTQNCS